MGWLRLAGSLKLQVSFAKEPYKRDDILQKRTIIWRSLLIVAIPYPLVHGYEIYTWMWNTYRDTCISFPRCIRQVDPKAYTHIFHIYCCTWIWNVGIYRRHMYLLAALHQASGSEGVQHACVQKQCQVFWDVKSFEKRRSGDWLILMVLRIISFIVQLIHFALSKISL